MGFSLVEYSALQVADDVDFLAVSRPHQAALDEADRLRSAYEVLAAKYRAMPGTPDTSGGAPPDAPLA